MKTAQDKIIEYVIAYKELFADEYQQFLIGRKEKIDMNLTKFAEPDKDLPSIDRQLHEIPNTLFTILKTRLKEEEWAYFDSIKGSRWFARKYKEFRSAERV